MHHFDVELERRQLLQRSRLERVRQAIEGQQMRLSVQPVIDLASGALCFAEALVRWQHPQQGLLAPEDWLGWIGAAVARHPDLPASALRLERCWRPPPWRTWSRWPGPSPAAATWG